MAGRQYNLLSELVQKLVCDFFFFFNDCNDFPEGLVEFLYIESSVLNSLERLVV